jgi:hypothetical protein
MSFPPRDILQGDSSDHAAYFAINSVRRLTGKDVRNQPVEEMDVGKTRQRVLKRLLKNKLVFFYLVLWCNSIGARPCFF